MGSLRLLAIAALALTRPTGAVVGPAPVNTQRVADWHAYVTEASARFAVPTTWIEAVMHVESGGRTMLGGRPIRSGAGAIGLMQLMPSTWAEMRAAYRLGSDPDDPRDNILGGTAYLRLMYDRFGYPGLFAAYNAGPARYFDHRQRGNLLPLETEHYLALVRLAVLAARPTGSPSAETRRGYAAIEGRREPHQQLFVSIRPEEAATDTVTPEAPTSPLFVTLSPH